MPTRLGVLLINLGTPDDTSPGAVRRYLAEFLADPRVVDLPRWLWLPVLYGIILTVRPAKLSRKYRLIWGRKDGPLRGIMAALAERTREALRTCLPGQDVMVRAAMTYGAPSIHSVLDEMKAASVRDYIILPVYPQYSNATTGAVQDQLARYLSRREVPSYRFIAHYHDDPRYIGALATSVQRHRLYLREKTMVLFSFHGIPVSQAEQGDPYPDHCQRTAQAVADALDLPHWRMTFQSRFGPAPWLTPYTDETLASLPGEGYKRVLVICPGFATECLETLEEIRMENRDIFLSSGGEAFKYAKALNATRPHVDLLRDLVLDHLYTRESLSGGPA
jgi:ferrochelatase